MKATSFAFDAEEIAAGGCSTSSRALGGLVCYRAPTHQ